MWNLDDLNAIPTRPTISEEGVPVATDIDRVGLEDISVVPLVQGDKVPGGPRIPTPREHMETEKILRPGMFSSIKRMFRR